MRLMLMGAGFVFTGLGILGIFLPLLPTTPFMLLAAACFARSSDRFYRWLMSHRRLGPYIRDYREKRGITLKIKIIALTLLWLTIGASAILVISSWWLRGLLLAIAIGVTIHLGRLKTLK